MCEIGYQVVGEPTVARYEHQRLGRCGITHDADTVTERLEGNNLRVWEPDTFSRTGEIDVLARYNHPSSVNVDTFGVFNSVTFEGPDPVIDAFQYADAYALRAPNELTTRLVFEVLRARKGPDNLQIGRASCRERV